MAEEPLSNQEALARALAAAEEAAAEAKKYAEQAQVAAQEVEELQEKVSKLAAKVKKQKKKIGGKLALYLDKKAKGAKRKNKAKQDVADALKKTKK